MKLKIELNREECIGAAACVAVASKIWEMEADGKVSIIGGNKLEDGKKEEILIDTQNDEDIESIIESAKVCPVAVIKIFNTETGEQVA